jgi:hypothetical protein
MGSKHRNTLYVYTLYSYNTDLKSNVILRFPFLCDMTTHHGLDSRLFETTKRLPGSKTGKGCYLYNYFAPLLL